MDTKKLQGFLEKLDYGPAPESAQDVRAWLGAVGTKPAFRHYIGGGWTRSEDGRTRSVIDPSTNEVIAEVAEADHRDVDKAMKAAERAFPSWRDLGGHGRAKYLYAIARVLQKHARFFAVLESLNNGKTIRETRDIDIPLAIRHFYYHAGWAEVHEHEYPALVAGGVVGQIIPWNFPLLMLAWKIAPAIAVGNTVVLKPAETTPLTALFFAELLKDEVGLPSGVVNIVTGGGEAGEAIVSHPTPWKIAFTGSTEVGRIIRRKTAGSGKRLTMELGGKSPFIVFADADLDAAVEGVVDAIWFNQGQVCCAGSRLLVDESVHDEFVRRLKVRASKLRVGPPLDKAVDIGAVNSLEQFEKINRLIALGVEEGGECWQPSGSMFPNQKGFFVLPTIFTGIEPSHVIAQEEIFGPVLAVMSFRTPEEAIVLANNTRYGLAASVWTENIGKAHAVASKLKAGTVWVNSTNLFDAAAGFGGFRESGYGKEGGPEGILEVLRSPRDELACVGTPQKQKTLDPSTEVCEQDDIDRTMRLFIGGKLVRPDGGTSFRVRAPDGTPIRTVSNANRKDVRNAVEAARNSFPSWSGQSAHLRAQILYFLAENLSADKERFARLITRSSGVERAKAEREVTVSVERLFHYAAYADKFLGTVQPVSPKMSVIAVKEPIGVMGIQSPDDPPLLGFVSSVAPALVMGNTVVVTLGEFPLPALELVSIIQSSDIPAGVLNILSAKNPSSLTGVLAEHDDVDALWYFGGGAGALSVETASAHNMKRTWAAHAIDWYCADRMSKQFLLEATQVKNIWTPFGL